ncbi:lipopolysaccharide transport periplasmic protein LptA [Ostreiculturibacter nitratireducens]|uniref:lipopolysaccharide transport periplasmic protein LptA n=1 Tax=Ostreiculturibacter nitratireducens TaxID=3075226 RepID=UPI0031B62689
MIRAIAALCVFVLTALPALAQGTGVSFGGIRADTTQPVEVSADQLAVNQNDGTATFTGNVIVGQGEMRLSAAEVRVEYATGDQRKIERLHATGGVTLVSGADAAEAAEAVYTIDTGVVVMTGSVLLTQGQSAISGEKLTVDLNSGTGVMEGRVRTILQTGGGD